MFQFITQYLSDTLHMNTCHGEFSLRILADAMLAVLLCCNVVHVRHEWTT
jgi:hypothetical protein